MAKVLLRSPSVFRAFIFTYLKAIVPARRRFIVAFFVGISVGVWSLDEDSESVQE